MSTQQTQLADEITLDEKRAQERARVKNYKTKRKFKTSRQTWYMRLSGTYKWNFKCYWFN